MPKKKKEKASYKIGSGKLGDVTKPKRRLDISPEVQKIIDQKLAEMGELSYTVSIKETAEEQKKRLLQERFEERIIPKVDEGVRQNENMTNESLMRFYRENHVSEFLKPYNDGKIVKFEFGELLKPYGGVGLDENGENEIIKKLSYAEIPKKAFVNAINLSVRYINYFIEYFDDDDELLFAYFNIMFRLHQHDSPIMPDDFADYVLGWFTSDSLRDKVVRMVEYNTDSSLIKSSTGKSYNESIQLTVEHLKAIMGISMFHRFTIPVVSHYYKLYRKEMDACGMKDSNLYFRIFASFIRLFDDVYDISLYNKIYNTASTRISKTRNSEKPMWERLGNYGSTPVSYVHILMLEYLNDISQKTVFDRSAITYLHKCFDRAVRNELTKADKYELSTMTMESSDNVNETITKWDRWQISKSKHSEKERIRGYVSIKDIIQRLGMKFGLDFETFPKEVSDEYEYYRENIKRPMDKIQTKLIQLYLANKLECAEDVKMPEFPDIVKIIMIMKRDLSKRNYLYLPFFISSEISSDPNQIHKCNKKRAEKLFTNHPLYTTWKDQYVDTYEFINTDDIYSDLKILMSSPIYPVVDYEYEHVRGNKMVPGEEVVVDEYIRLLCET